MVNAIKKTETSAPSAALRSTTHAERVSALTAHKRAREAELAQNVAELERRISACRAEHERSIADAERTVAEAYREVETALAAETAATLSPLAARFGDAPRQTAKAYGEAWRAIVARSKRDLGEPPWVGHVALAFAEATGGAERAAASGALSGSVLEATHRAAKALEQAAGDALVEEELRKLEAEIQRHIATAWRYPNAARLAIIRSHVVAREVLRAVEAHERAETARTSAVASPVVGARIIRGAA